MIQLASWLILLFFFQAEDGIRDYKVTGVQTCALPISLVGRLQLKSEAGAWSEWVAAFSDGALGFLSEDNGQFVWSWPWEAEALRNGPFKASDWLLGSQRVLGGKSFTVSSVQNARLVSAQGELAQLPEPGTPYRLVELRSEQGQVLSVDFSAQPPALSLGERVVLDDLRLQGLRDGASLKGEQGRHFNCPKCGAVVPVRFTTTKSLSCPSCGSLVDLSQGIGKELSYAEQNEPVRPAIPLGDRKSTRLNSSHLVISYAVFCLKKKKKNVFRFLGDPICCA